MAFTNARFVRKALKRYKDPGPAAPTVRISGFALMGGVEVLVRYPGETSRDARRRMKEERKRLQRGTRREDEV